MSENEFYTLQGNRYRGSRYSNFAGAGIDPQGNVSSAVNENASNMAAASAPQQPQNASGEGVAENPVMPTVSRNAVSQGLLGAPTPPTLGGAAKDLVIGAALPTAGAALGGATGAALASGATGSEAFARGASALANKFTGGLIGTPGNATNAALAGMGGKFGPATSSAVSKASGGISMGGGVGTGLGTAAATLLTGGSPKQAAASGLGSGVGYAIGNAILPGVGGFIGSTLGSMLGGLVGPKQGRNTMGVILGLDDSGKFMTSKVSTKDASKSNAQKYASSISKILNTFSEATGIKYKTGVFSETNVGKKDAGTFFNNKRVSGTPGDAGAVALGFLKNRKGYDTGADADFNKFWDDAINSSKSIGDLGKRVDQFYASRGLMAGPSASANPQQGNVPTMPYMRQKNMSFYG